MKQKTELERVVQLLKRVWGLRYLGETKGSHYFANEALGILVDIIADAEDPDLVFRPMPGTYKQSRRDARKIRFLSKIIRIYLRKVALPIISCAGIKQDAPGVLAGLDNF